MCLRVCLTVAGSADGSARLDGLEGDLRNLLIDGLKLGDVDGQADIWTMSPPCQVEHHTISITFPCPSRAV